MGWSWDGQQWRPQGLQLRFIFPPGASTPVGVQAGGPGVLHPTDGGSLPVLPGLGFPRRGESARGTHVLPVGSDSGGAADKKTTSPQKK